MSKLGLAILSVLAIGCGDDGGGGSGTIDAPAAIDAPRPIDAAIDAPPGAFIVNGTVAAGGTVTNGVTAVLWIVSSGSPDYVYKFGSGTSTSTMFMVTVGMTPPAQAINSYGVGVGLVGLFPAGTVLPDGMVTDAQIQNASFSDRYAIIYKAPNASSAVPWIAPFADGLSCGRCVDASSGFDSFEPIACSMVEIVHGAMNVCNWT